MSAENGCHGGGFVEDPYNLGTPATPYTDSVCHTLCLHAVNQRAAELAAPQSISPLQHTPRTTAQQMRGLDDPHEWFFGGPGTSMPTTQTTDPLLRDDAFSANAQPGAAGVWLGYREAMFIRDGKVYVGSADGLVSSFEVDASHAREPLVRVALGGPGPPSARNFA